MPLGVAIDCEDALRPSLAAGVVRSPRSHAPEPPTQVEGSADAGTGTSKETEPSPLISISKLSSGGGVATVNDVLEVWRAVTTTSYLPGSSPTLHDRHGSI